MANNRYVIHGECVTKQREEKERGSNETIRHHTP